jgi:RHS repeat-associated protein
VGCLKLHKEKNFASVKGALGLYVSYRNNCTDDYRFGFNGMHKDNEVKGTGNSLDFGARIYDSRLGRWLSVDPYSAKSPHLNPYNFGANNPVINIDPDGNTEYYFQGKWAGTDGVKNNLVGIITDNKIAQEIISNSNKGLLVPQVSNLKNGGSFNGGIVIESNVLSTSLTVLGLAEKSTNPKEEFMTSMSDNGNGFEKNQEIKSNNGAETNGNASGEIVSGEVSIHSHPMNDAKWEGDGVTSSYAFPSPTDKGTMTRFKMNIIVGRDKLAQGTITNASIGTGMTYRDISYGNPVINIFGGGPIPNYTPVSIPKKEAIDILAGPSGKTYNKFQKTNKPPDVDKTPAK